MCHLHNTLQVRHPLGMRMAVTLQCEMNCKSKSWGLPHCLPIAWKDCGKHFHPCPWCPWEERVTGPGHACQRCHLCSCCGEHRVARLSILPSCLVTSLAALESLSLVSKSCLSLCFLKTLKTYYFLFLFKNSLLSWHGLSVQSWLAWKLLCRLALNLK